MSKKILITGASGFIGGRLFKELKGTGAVGIGYKVSEKDRAAGILDIDLRDEKALKELFERVSPEVIYHFAALVVPKINEENPDLARQMHLDVTRNVLSNMNKDAHIIFLSTDKVFDGSEACPDEASMPRPTSLYGRLKAEAEEMVRKMAPRHHIFRLPIVHSSGDPASTSFVDRSLIALKSGQSVSAFSNVKRCYIKLDELMDILMKSADSEDYGTYHTGCDMDTYSNRIEKMCRKCGISYGGLLQKGEGSVVPLVQDLNRKKIAKAFGVRFT